MSSEAPADAPDIPKGYQLEKATLVYADNARGKSALSAILQACAANGTP